MSRDPALTLVDAEAGGDVSRVIIGGAPRLREASVAEQCADFARRFDHLRLKLIRPPHGAPHMCPVLLLPARGPESDFGVIIMESMGYPPISGSNLFCAAAVALDRGLVAPRPPVTRLRVETPAGIVRLSAQWRRQGRGRIAFENTPARVKRSLSAALGATHVPVTVVSAGVDYAVVAADSLGLALAPGCEAALREHGGRLADAAGTDFVLFHEPIRRSGRRARCTVAVFQRPAVICRSPTGTGTSALLALAHERGLLAPEQPLVTRSPAGGRFAGYLLCPPEAGTSLRTLVSGRAALGPAHTID